ncbi:MAG: hypothetical protein ACREF9_15980, partial [Opitutaceae bacterium]
PTSNRTAWIRLLNAKYSYSVIVTLRFGAAGRNKLPFLRSRLSWHTERTGHTARNWSCGAAIFRRTSSPPRPHRDDLITHLADA